MADVKLAGGGDATPGEKRALAILATLPKSWTVIANKILAFGPTNSFEIDFIVIGPHRIIILDEKSYWGKITGSDEVWTLDGGSSTRSPFGKIDMIARKLAGLIDKRVAGFPGKQSGVVPVIGGIMLSNDSATAHIHDLRASRCLLTGDNAIERLLWLDGEAEKAGIDLSPIHSQISTALYNDNSAHKPKRPSQIGLFSIDDEIDERDECRVFLARNVAGESRTLYVYPHNPDTKAVQETLNHDLLSLSLLQPTRVVPTIGERFLWSEDNYLVVPVHPPAGTAIGARPKPASQDAAIREIESAAAAFYALDRVHEQGITHRAIRPETIYIDDPEPPAANAREATLPQATITGFVAAHIDQTATIYASLDEAGFQDTYSAPEIVTFQSYSFADRSSDVYSLALVTLERLMNRPAHTLVSGESIAIPVAGDADLWPFLTEDAIEQLRSAYSGALTSGAVNNEPRSTAKEMAANLQHIAGNARKVLPWEKGLVPGTDLEIISLLGEGSSARTYLLYDTTNDRNVAGKEFFRPNALEEAVHEFNVLFDHWHPNLPKVVGKPDRSRPHFQILLEYIDGETLRSLLPAIAHDREQWANLMSQLLEAVEHLEQHNLLHRDIKPENIMIRDSDGRTFLIDYGASATTDDPGFLSGSPRYWPPEWKQGTTHPLTTDRYAVAVTLFEALTGESPFKTTGAAFHGDLMETLPVSLPPELHAAARTLLKALSLDPADRFASSSELRTALIQALETRDPVIPPDNSPTPEQIAETNKWINNIRGLFRNSTRGNADNRGLETAFARNTYVETSLDNRVRPEILAQRPAVVFLSGNPGDGKTAFLEQVRDSLAQARASMVVAESNASGWEARHGDHVFRACFDASESADDRSADEQLAHRLRGHEGDAPDPNVTVLVAINDGRLAEMKQSLGESFPWLIGEADRVSQRGVELDVAQDPVWVVDLKQRSYVALKPDPANRSVMREMLATLVESSRWPASRREGQQLTAIENAAALRSDAGDGPAARLEWLFALAHLRGDRHMTVRDLRSALSYLITHDIDPDADTRRQQSWAGKYWNTLFTTNSNIDLVLGELEWLDPARFAHPELERFLYFRHRPEDAPVRSRLFANGIDEPPPPGSDPGELSEWIAAVKRRLVLEGAADSPDLPLRIDPTDLQPYRAAADLIAILSGEKSASSILPRILRGIGRSDGIAEARNTDDLVLRVKKSEEYDIEIVKLFPTAEFDLAVESPTSGSLIETIPRTLLLSHEKSGARVRLNLDLIEILVRLADGLDPASQELGSLLEELLPFKSRVQRGNTQRLLVIEGGRKHSIERHQGKLVRTDA